MTAPERGSRGVRPTGVGTVLMREASPLLAHAGRTTAAVRGAVAGEEGELGFGFLGSVANCMMPPVVRALRARHPGVALQIRDVPIAKRVAGRRDATSTPASCARCSWTN